MKAVTRIKVLSVVFVLLAVAAWFALQEKFTTDKITKDTGGIAVEDTASITKVTIEKDGQKQVLTRAKKGWIINQKYETQDYPSYMLMVGLNQLQVKRPVSEESQAKVMRDLKEKGATVTVEYPEGKKVLRFLSNENDINSTYVVPEGEQKAYVAYVPGIPGDINTLFRFNESDWRSKKLFSSLPSTIQSIKVSYPQKPVDNFEIIYADRKFSIPGIAQLDSAKFGQYISLYQNVPVAGYITNAADSVKNALAKKPVFAKIEFTDLDPEKSNLVEIYREESDSKHYLGKIGKTGEPVTLNRQFFDMLLVKKDNFIKR